jgi:AraC family transcriptional regulator
LSYYLERIQRGVDHIETRLDDAIDLAHVARAAGLSQWHFQRIFKALTGETLKTYIRSRRLARALERLLARDLRILDIALLAGFESQEAFARAFKDAFGLTPQAYRKIGDKSLFVRKPQFDAAYLEHLQGHVSLAPELRDQPSMTLVGLRTCFFSVDSEKNNIAEQLPPLWQAFLPRMAEVQRRIDGPGYGVVQQEREDSERLEYHAAVAVEEAHALPEGMLSVEVPTATYAIFEHRGAVKGIDHTVSYIYGTWLMQSGSRHTSGPDLEIYGKQYHPTRDDSLIHYAIPVA